MDETGVGAHANAVDGPLHGLREAVRRCEARALGLEIALWGATAVGTAPLGTLRRLEGLREEARADPERFDHGEPVLTWLLAWAQHLCRRSEDAAINGPLGSVDSRMRVVRHAVPGHALGAGLKERGLLKRTVLRDLLGHTYRLPAAGATGGARAA